MKKKRKKAAGDASKPRVSRPPRNKRTRAVATSTRQTAVADPARELTPRERAICEAHYARQADNPSPPFKVIGEGDNARLDFHHPQPGLAVVLAMRALGTSSLSFYTGVVGQLAALDPSGTLNERELNFAASAIKGIGPRDEAEAMLAAQMFAVHRATMKAARRLAAATTIEELDSASNGLNKLARTYVAQFEALKRHRTNGVQTIKVQHQHVTVNGGGQAIVAGSVTGGGAGAGGQLEEQFHEPSIAPPSSATLLSEVEAIGTALPGAS